MSLTSLSHLLSLVCPHRPCSPSRAHGRQPELLSGHCHAETVSPPVPARTWFLYGLCFSHSPPHSLPLRTRHSLQHFCSEAPLNCTTPRIYFSFNCVCVEHYKLQSYQDNYQIITMHLHFPSFSTEM